LLWLISTAKSKCGRRPIGKAGISLLNDNIIALERSPKDHIEAGAPPIKTKYGWLLIYSYIQNYFAPPAVFGIEAALLDINNPQRIIARTDKPLLVPQEEYEKYGKVPNIVFPTGQWLKTAVCIFITVRRIRLVRLPLANWIYCWMTCWKLNKANPIKPLSRQSGHQADPKLAWQSRAVFNPTALYEYGRVHLAYRAMSEDNTSVIGFASSGDGYNFDDRPTEPIIRRVKTSRRNWCPVAIPVARPSANKNRRYYLYVIYGV